MSFGDVQRLRALALVLDLGSISAAASVLGYTQSAVSQQLAALEREVGTALVDRSQRPLRPTRAGALLRPHVERVLAALGGAEAAVEDLRGPAPRALAARRPGAAARDAGGRRAPPRRRRRPRGGPPHARGGGPRDRGPAAPPPARRPPPRGASRGPPARA